MKRYLLILVLFLPCARLIAQVQQVRVAHTYAIVIGISQYSKENNLPSLKYAHRDAEEFARYLQSPAGGSVPTEHIILLKNEEATLAAVDNALYQVRDSTGTNDLVYFYFAGHGDKQTSFHDNLGFLLTYNTPRFNYLNNALRIEDLNDFADGLSISNKANVVLITDACHSGDLAINGFRGSPMVNEALRSVKNKEIRITSCDTDQLSVEGPDWGGGRGVFSWYLVNGLKGYASRNGQGNINLGDLQVYLDSCFAVDRVLDEDQQKEHARKQNPVLKGNTGFILARMDTQALAGLRKMSIGQPGKFSISTALRPLPIQPADLFFQYLKMQPIEARLNFFLLDSLKPSEIPIACIDQLLTNKLTDGFRDTMNTLKASLQTDKDKLNRFTDRLVEMMHNRGQDIINLYIAGDAAELEKRRYYNINSSGYDVFPRMFSTALKLTSPSNYLYRTLQVDQHYFAGVAARLKIPTVEDPGPLIDLSLSEQGMALQLLGNAAYIQNELGNLYQIKGDLTKAADYFTRATQIEQGWAIPWANLCGLYALQRKFTDGIQAGRTADSLQPGLNLTNNNLGLLYQMAGNLMLAEGYYRHSIDINSRFYFPYEKLGQVYTMNTKYALADSFYNEAEKRKKGFHFNGNSKYPSLNIVDLEDFLSMLSPCNPDTSQFDKNDQAAFFWWGYSQYEIRNYTKAEQLLRKVVSIDRNNPLVYHYLGKLCYDQHQWEKAAVQFKLAVSNYLDEASFKQYCDKKIVGTYPYDHHCLEDFFRGSRYKREEDLYFLAAIFDSTRHYEEAEILYRTIIQMVPDNICGYYKLWHLLETTGRFAEAEKILLGYAAIEQEQFRNSQVGGNNQFKDRSDYITDYIKEELLNLYRKAIKQFPDDGYWYYKIGILDYELAPVSRMPLRDTIIYFPVLNKERFYNQAYQNNSNTSGLDSLQLTKQPGPTGDGNKDYVTKPLKISIPGTNQVILLDEIDLETPRQDAIRYLSRAAELLQDSITLADIYFRIGNVYVMAGSKKLAIPYYSRSIQFDTANAGVRLRMIDASHAAYQNSLVKENLEYLYRHNELDLPNRLLLAEFDIHAREFAEAGLLLDEAAMMMPYPIPDIIELNGRLQLLSGQPAKALTWYNEHLARVPNDPMTQYTIGRLYAQLKEPGQAYKWLELALNNGFNFSNVLAGDAIWKFYRGTSAWNELLAKFPKMKKYAPDE